MNARYKTAISVVVTTTAFAINSVFGQPMPQGERTTAIAISSSKQELLLGEPIVIQLTVSNVTTTNITIATEMKNGRGWANYMVSGDGKEFTNIIPPSVRDPVGRKETLRPTQAYYHEEILGYSADGGGFVCPAPGEYYIRVACFGLKSNSIKIQVHPPATTAEKKWAEVFREKDVLFNFALPTWRTERIVNMLTECAMEQTVYSPYAAYAVAAGEKNQTNALALFQRADIAGFPLRSQAILGQARIHEELGNAQPARQLYERLATEFPNTAAAMEAGKRLATTQTIP